MLKEPKLSSIDWLLELSAPSDEEASEVADHKSIEIVTFALGKETYALPLIDLREILVPPKITPVPGAPPFFLGVINLRGTILPVLALKPLVGMSDPDMGTSARIIVAEWQRVLLGLAVDSVSGAALIDSEAIEPPLATLGGPQSQYVAGESRVDGALVALLNLEKVFACREEIEKGA